MYVEDYLSSAVGHTPTLFLSCVVKRPLELISSHIRTIFKGVLTALNVVEDYLSSAVGHTPIYVIGARIHLIIKILLFLHSKKRKYFTYLFLSIIDGRVGT